MAIKKTQRAGQQRQRSLLGNIPHSVAQGECTKSCRRKGELACSISHPPKRLAEDSLTAPKLRFVSFLTPVLLSFDLPDPNRKNRLPGRAHSIRLSSPLNSSTTTTPMIPIMPSTPTP